MQAVDGPPLPDATGLRRQVLLEAAVVALLVAACAVLSLRFDGPDVVWSWGRRTWPGLNQIVLLLAVSHVFMLAFGQRRALQLKREFSRRHEVERDLARRACHDDLTGLLNRAGFARAAEEAIAAMSGAGADRGNGRDPAGVALLLIDLDRFKEINDTLGHHVGDQLLQSVAQRFLAELGEHRESGDLARLGGDEFAVVLSDCDAGRAEHVARRLLAAIHRPFPVTGMALEVEASIGLALGPDHGDEARELLQHADAALYAAKAQHSGMVTYSPAEHAVDPERLGLYGDLRRAITNGQLQVHYQPKVCLSEGRVRGVEALVRWAHPRRGLLPPGEFIDVAEQTGLIRDLTDVVLDQALADCRRWHQQGLDVAVSVNLSARSLLDADLPPRVAALLQHHQLAPADLELEVTESAAMQDPRRALQVLHRLRELGISLSIDDYGTGHASLAYLSQLPVTVLKIDRSFIQALGADPSQVAGCRNHTIVRSTINMAHSLGLRVVAEGIEHREAWDELGRLGCDDAQGYWLARPAPADQLTVQVDRIRRLLATPPLPTAATPTSPAPRS